MIDRPIQCTACGASIPPSTLRSPNGALCCPECGTEAEGHPRFLGAGRGPGSGERTDDPVTMPAIPASAFEPAVPVAFAGPKAWKKPVGFTSPFDTPGGEPRAEMLDAAPSSDPTPERERVAHPIEAPMPPPVLRSIDSVPPSSVDAPIPRALTPTPNPSRAARPEPAPVRPAPVPTPNQNHASPVAAPARQPRADAPRPKSEPVRPQAAPAKAPAASAPAASAPPSAPIAPAAPVTRDEAVEPSGAFTESEESGVLVVEWRWPGIVAIALGAVASVWAGLLMGWVPAGVYLLSSGGLLLVLGLLMCGIHVGTAAVLAYVAAVAWFDRTRVRVSREGISVSTGPLPWPGSREVPVATIARLAVSEGRGGHGVAAVLLQGREVTLAHGIPDVREAKGLRARVAGRLGNPLLQEDRPSGPKKQVARAG